MSEGCYICHPDNPDAAEEGCARCDAEYASFMAALAEAIQNDSPSPAVSSTPERKPR